MAPQRRPGARGVVLHDRVTTAESVLRAQPIEHPLGGVALLARAPAILLQPLADELGEPVELRATHLRCAPIPRAARRTAASSSRSRAKSRNASPPRARSSPPGTPSVPCDTAPRYESPRPPRRRKGPHWQSFAPPRQGPPRATVVYFCTAVSTRADASASFHLTSRTGYCPYNFLHSHCEHLFRESPHTICRTTLYQQHFSRPCLNMSPASTRHALTTTPGTVLLIALLLMTAQTAIAQQTNFIPLVTPATNLNQQGFVRIINRSNRAGQVTIRAFDDTGRRFGPIYLSLDAYETHTSTRRTWNEETRRRDYPPESETAAETGVSNSVRA